MVNYKLQYGLAAAIMLSAVYCAHGRDVTVGYVQVDADSLVILDNNQVKVGTVVRKSKLCATLADAYTRSVGGAIVDQSQVDRIYKLLTAPGACNKFPQTEVKSYYRVVASLGLFWDSIKFVSITSLTSNVTLAYLYQGAVGSITVQRAESGASEARKFAESDANVFQSILEAILGEDTVSKRQVDLTARKIKEAVENAREMAKTSGDMWLVTITSSYDAETGDGGVRAVPSHVSKLPTRSAVASVAAVAATVAAGAKADPAKAVESVATGTGVSVGQTTSGSRRLKRRRGRTARRRSSRKTLRRNSRQPTK